MEVADYLVDAQVSGNVASFLTHLVEALGVVFPLALLYAFAFAEGPAVGCIRLPHVITGLAAAITILLGGWGAVAFSAVGRVKMGGSVFVEVQGGGRDWLGFWEGG